MLNKDLKHTIREILQMLLGTFQHRRSILPLRIIIVNSLQAKNPKELKALQRNWF
jgi:hypothetical protein